MKMLFNAILPGLLALGVTAAGENLVKNGDAENGIDNWTNVQLSSENPHSGKNFFAMTEQTSVMSKELIPIDNQKSYNLSGWFKSAGTSPVKTMLFGFVPYDENKKQILSQEINIVQGTETELTEECSAENMIVKIKDGSKWVIDDGATQRLIAFNTDSSGEYKDLPNRETSLSGIESVTKKDDYWELKLKKPCGKNFPAGTKIREHSNGNTYIYPLITSNVGLEWKEYSTVINLKAKFGASTTQWWPGTKFVNILVLPLNGKVFFDDIKLEEAK